MENKSKRLEFWEQPAQLSLLRFYARRFNNLKEIAKHMGIGIVTLWRWQKDSPLIHETLIHNKWIRVAEIEDLLYDKAKEGKFWAINRYLRAFGGKNHSPHLFAAYDDCGIGLTAEVLSETQPAEEEIKPSKKAAKNPKGWHTVRQNEGNLPEEIAKNIPDGVERVIYKYTKR